MSGLNILIVGASIAGPTTAYWFARAGANVTIIERWPHLREGGHNIDIRTTGLTVMRKMPGMEAAVKAKKVDLEGISFVDDDGKAFATLQSTGDPDQQSLISDFEIFRGDLAKILYDMTKDNPAIKYVFGEQVTAIRQTNKEDGPVIVDFMNGYPSSRYDLVVACDGSTSRTRAIGLDCGVRTHIHSMNIWASYFSIAGDIMDASKTVVTWSQTLGRSVFMARDEAGGKTRVGLMNVLPGKDVQTSENFRAAAKESNDSLKKCFADRFASPSWRIPEILNGLQESDDFYATEIVQVKIPNLYRGRFVMVGDAGYSPGLTGAGTSLAIGGAYVLAGEVCKHKGDVAAGLKAYEKRMKPIIKDMQQVPPGMATILAPQTEWGLWFRRCVLVVVVWAARFGGVFGGLFSWVGGLYSTAFGRDKFGLPDYEWVR